MAGSVQDKSATGLEFAEQQLLRHGWEKGKGLGRTESGISEAVKVKIKCGKGGIGHKEGEQFTFHWWDHVFNKASSSLVVETGKDGVLVKADNHNDVLISNKKPRKAQQAKSMLYGRFVKSATLLSGEEQPDKTSDSDDSSSSSEDEDQKLDLSSTTKLSDEDLLKACGGRTAHKGARHGLTLSAKLARLEQQEQEFMNKYGKKNQTSKTPQSKTVVSDPNPKGSPDITEEKKCKKSKRKEKPSVNDIHYGQTTRHILGCNEIVDSKPKMNDISNGLPSINDDTMADTKPKKKKNRKKKNALPEEVNGDCSIAVNKMSTHTTERPQQQRAEEEALHQQMNESIPKKKKKKKRKSEMVAVAKKGVTANTDVISEDYTDSHDKQIQKDGFENKQTSESASKKKKRRKQASRDHHETSPSIDEENSTSFVTTTTQDTSTERLNIDTETKGLEKKPKKKKKRREVVENFEEYVPKKSKE